ncbi:unnamed protein product [Ranitomeya imitator]|uniref:Synaptotagmin SMP domain-containing protein n=1 Tax=Ranitomeya imitator TaxID=111125 RepID=A0ABN9LDR7_9NEOB|nr:unnamed protein product [Ranitomeya imitator]
MDKKQIILDLNVSYVGNIEIDVEVKKYFCKAGVKGVQLHGMIRVILEPLIGDLPVVGAITIFFIKRPLLDLNWTGLTNLLDIPGLNANIFRNALQFFAHIIITVPDGAHNLNSLSVGLWNVGGNRSARRKPMQTLGEHTNFLQMLSKVGLEPRTPVLQGCSAIH